MRYLCWVYGEDRHSHFSVNGADIDTVGELQKLIKDAKPVRFRAVDANNIQLYRLSRPREREQPYAFCQPEEKVQLVESLGRVSLRDKRCLDSDADVCDLGLYDYLVVAYAPNPPDITINYWIRADAPLPGREFSIDVSPTRTIGELRQLIRSTHSSELGDAGAMELYYLFRVPDVDPDDGSVEAGIEGMTPLPLFDMIWDYFPVVPLARRVHIVVDQIRF